MDKIEAERLLRSMIERIIDQLEVAIPFINQLDPTRQDVLINMTYNLGLAGLLKFKKMLAAVKSGQYDKAAEEMLNSKWRSDVGDRAKELSMQMATGVYANVN
jgi:lysozyme